MIKPYPKVWQMGEGFIRNIFDGSVEITEKIDGSQFGFGLGENGEIEIRSHGKEMFLDAYEKMFTLAVESVLKKSDIIKSFKPGTMFYGEFLSKNKHNVLCYDRVPKDNIMLFGVRGADGVFDDSYDGLAYFAGLLGLEAVPLLKHGEIKSIQEVVDLLNTDSILGGTKIEGFVIKNYHQFTPIIGGSAYPCFGKYVSEKFKEKHNQEWSAGKDKVELLIEGYRTEARWIKAIQHLRENGELEHSPRDIGKLIKEISSDFTVEEKEDIKSKLYTIYADRFKRKLVAGFPEWYKSQLLEGTKVSKNWVEDETN